MDPLTIAALVSGGLNLAKGIFGGAQTAGANKDIKALRANRPIYTTPASATKATQMAGQMARSDMPGMDALRERLGRTSSAGARQVRQAAPSSSAALGAMTDIYGRQMDAERDLQYQNAVFRQQMQQQYMGQLGRQAQYEDQAFNLNQWIPYQTQMNELMSKKQAGMDNVWGALQGGASTASNFMGTQAQLQAMNRMYPQYGGGQGQAMGPNYGPTGPAGAQPLQTPNMPNVTNQIKI